MADHGDDDAPDETPGYQPPAPKSMEEILKSDADDESLRKYKESLLGSGNTIGLEIFPNDPRRVIVQKLTLVVDGRPDVDLDLSEQWLGSARSDIIVDGNMVEQVNLNSHQSSDDGSQSAVRHHIAFASADMLYLGDLSKMKDATFTIAEGCFYQLKISFYVQREIVTGLKYLQSSYRAGIRVDKSSFMVGSYGPKPELQSYITPREEAPSGMLARGTYAIKSLFTDDDKVEHLKWEWNLEIKKDWE